MEELCPKENGRYKNPHVGNIRRRPINALLWKMGWYNDPKEHVHPPTGFVYPSPQEKVDHKKPTVQWINHDTFLIRCGDIAMLTDPIWSHRCSPVPFAGPKRRHPPPFPLEKLPKIDFVLISHDHYDHLDKKSVVSLFLRHPEIQWLVPHGVKKWFRSLGITNVIELSWWEEIHLHHHLPLKATAVPAQHFSGRGLFNTNRTLWVGWVVEFIPNVTENLRLGPSQSPEAGRSRLARISNTGDVEIAPAAGAFASARNQVFSDVRYNKTKTLYFAGDTGYNGIQFKEIGAKWQTIDLSLIPIGCYVPRKFMSSVHADPEDAVNIHTDVGSKLSVAMHWKTFNLANEALHLPPYDLFCALQKKGLDPKTFRVLQPGHEINW